MASEYKKTFVKLKNELDQYSFSRGKSDIVRDIYALKNELEAINDIDSKNILVGVYELLKYHVEAYNLFLEITPEEKLKNPNLSIKIAKMKDLAENTGNEFAIEQPYIYSSNFKMVTTNEFPKFKYHAKPMSSGAFKWKARPVVCSCCKKETNYKYSDSLLSYKDEMKNICPDCISNGSAAKKFNYTFIDSFIGTVSDKEKVEELMYRTPNYMGWQIGRWRTHCDDFCEFIDYVGINELKSLGILDEILSDPEWTEQDRENINQLDKTYSPQGYLFKCLHCGKHLLWYDFD